MRHSSHDASCGICKLNAGDTPIAGGIIWEDEHWLVRHQPAPIGVAGWMFLHTQRHVAGPAHFNDAEAASFGPTVRWLQKTLEEVTGALRIYTAAMGESFPHFHAHMVPRRPETPDGARAWGLFDLGRRAAAGEISVDQAEVDQVIAEYGRRLRESRP
jgi:diadenosine tetraphosphate (Ap4A) HIT family hydrolase